MGKKSRYLIPARTHLAHLLTWRTWIRLVTCAFGIGLINACTGISIAPSCPNELEVDESGVIAANVINPGAVAWYEWQAIPADAGSFDDRTQPITRFTASKTGEVTIQLTAGDGLYLVQSACKISVVGAQSPGGLGIVVSLSANPPQPETGGVVTVTCRSIGDIPAVSFDIQRVAGLEFEFDRFSPNSIRFVPTETGSVTFQCFGQATDGTEGNPATLMLNITPGSGGDDRR